jgi:hypothetical protein
MLGAFETAIHHTLGLRLNGPPGPSLTVQRKCMSTIHHRIRRNPHTQRAENKAQGGKKDHRPKRGANVVKGAERGTRVAIRARSEAALLSSDSYSELPLGFSRAKSLPCLHLHSKCASLGTFYFSRNSIRQNVTNGLGANSPVLVPSAMY